LQGFATFLHHLGSPAVLLVVSKVEHTCENEEWSVQDGHRIELDGFWQK